MREILFKAKRLDTGEWVEGDLIHSWDEDNRVAISNSSNLYEVIPYTICQYTGLTDKNGNKIWENDVVCTPYVDPIFGDMVNREILDDYTWKVEFCDGCFCVLNDSHRITLKCFTNGNNIKVIGNIFDNPELLENE